ncbi:MAG: enoyl-CoA hydratase/isomerase family protein [Acidimicrobiia bacterium]
MTEIDTGTDTVRGEVRERVGIITLNRPQRRNALHVDMYEAVPRLLERFFDDSDIGCVLLTGAGDAFCAGGDVRDGRRRKRTDSPRPSVEEAAAMLTRSARMVLRLHEGPKISIAALPGPAVGAGIGLALAADLRIAAESARLIPGWGKLAFSGDFGGTWFLTRFLGASRALAVLVDDETIDAPTALELGLFNRVVADGELADAAFAWARSIASRPQTTLRYFKENVQQATRLTLRQALPLESERMVRSAQTDEHREALRQWLAAAASPRHKS